MDPGKWWRLPPTQPNEFKLFMQYWFFVDGAGKPQPHRYVVYCGYLIHQDYVEEFFRRWQTTLLEEQIPYLTMKECQNWEGIWGVKRRQWGEERADAERKRICWS